MPYVQHTSVANPQTLIDLLASFCAANGWTIERNTLAGNNRTLTVRKPGVSDYVHIYNTEQLSVMMRVSVGYTAANPPSTQPNVSAECRTDLEAGVYPRLSLFANGDSVWAAVSIAASGEYRHFTFGVVEKIGVYEGGTYCDCTYWGRDSNAWQTWQGTNTTPFYPNGNTSTQNRGWMRVNVAADGRVNHMFGMGSADSGTLPSATRSSVSLSSTAEGLMASNGDQNTFSGRSIFHVIPIYVTRTGSTTFYSPVGLVSGVRWGNINKFEPEQEVTIGSDVWVVYPPIAKRPRVSGTSATRQPGASGDACYAILKTP